MREVLMGRVVDGVLRPLGGARIVTGPPDPPPSVEPVYQVLASTAADRSGPTTLNGATLVAQPYVFTGPDTGVQSVAWSVDGKPTRTETTAPFDLVGSSATAPFNALPASLPAGSHTVSAVLTTIYGTRSVSATFTVPATEEEPPPPPPPPPGGGAGAPTRVASFGPNGTHWPDSPFMLDSTTPTIIDVACTWAAIRSALQGVSASQAAAGVLIRVADGTLPGQGIGGSSVPVLQDVGSAAWTRKVTIAPRNGYGAVSFSGGLKFLRARGFILAGMRGDSVKWEGCTNSGGAWLRLSGSWYAYGNNADGTTTKMQFCEVVQPLVKVGTGDYNDIYANNGAVSGFFLDGCYAGAVWRPQNETAHTDTVQFASGQGGSYGSMTIRDGCYFGATNAAVQTGSIKGLAVIHTWACGGGHAARTRYPVPSGAEGSPYDSAYNGGGGYAADGSRNMSFTDSIIIGGFAYSSGSNGPVVSQITRTRVSRAPASGIPVGSGSWTVDGSLTGEPLPPMPSDSYLSSIWRP